MRCALIETLKTLIPIEIIMIRHVVMFKFKASANGAPKAKNIEKAKSLLEVLPKKFPKSKI